MKIGVLALQGDVEEHVKAMEKALERLNVNGEVLEVKNLEELLSVQALAIPGGESTTIGKLLVRRNLLEPLKDRITLGMPVFATCAGLILLAKQIRDRVVGETNQPSLGVLDVEVVRNAFGRQRESFEVDLEFKGIGLVRAVFIRAPAITKVGNSVDVLSRLNDYIVAVREGNILALAFHPEVTEDTRIHEFFLKEFVL
ncbi:MAG: pyridoxal 5'-phosphate synthase glutaminase subunit PdxT [Thermoplasmata archaeon]|nr:pyridoxal 5'-phosphate synthase glutaminase subunit PdxT [Euryarchaeota archaeon]RLF65888.1 MAG: pyridoxal 5'-phosphate synthase glutaminase subunit PdxT [Thermoplasmata archaeon]